MRFKSMVVTALLLATGAANLHAQTIQLTFEGLADNQVIGNYYNGGAGGNLGVTFGTTALGLITRDVGGTGNFQGQPSGVTIMYFPSATNAFMDVAGGFNTGFSLYYTAISYAGSVEIWDGFGGTGTLLGTANLPLTPSTPNTPGCPTALPFCPFAASSVAFSGTGRSAVFTGAANQIGFDNVTFGSTNPNTNVTPEPASMVLVATGLLGVVGFARRRRQA